MGKILIISAVFPPEPVVSAKLSEDIANELSLAHQVTVIAPKPTRPFGFNLKEIDNKQTKYQLQNLDSYTCPESNALGRLRESYSFGVACGKYIAENHKNIDAIYMNSWPIFSQYLIVKTARKYKIKVITHVQDVYPESLSNKTPKLKAILNFVFLPLDKYVLKSSSKIIAISNEMKKYLVHTRTLYENDIKVVPNWQNEESFLDYNSKTTEDKESSFFTFMYLGNIGPVAGVDTIIKAFVKAELKGSKLVIAGSGSKKKELQRFVEISNAINIEFLDVPDGKVPEIQSLSNVMLLPIKKGAASSSIPSKLPAYMFSKKPIISCVDEDSATALAIKSSNCGWVLPPDNISSLSEMMQKVASINKEELLNKGENGFNYAVKNLSKKRNLHKLVKVINNL